MGMLAFPSHPTLSTYPYMNIHYYEIIFFCINTVCTRHAGVWLDPLTAVSE